MRHLLIVLGLACGVAHAPFGHASDPSPAPDPAPAEAPTPIEGHIVQVMPQGSETVLIIDRGSRQGVKVGATGHIGGVDAPFHVTDVYTFRCKATIAVPTRTIGGARNVTIEPNP
ncbi:MAG: hypothetical protein H6744_13435 [Deltaproteobacteria bacterium]|nr:hypothetical protein [Deltaproteobacteria bacterium]